MACEILVTKFASGATLWTRVFQMILHKHPGYLRATLTCAWNGVVLTCIKMSLQKKINFIRCSHEDTSGFFERLVCTNIIINKQNTLVENTEHTPGEQFESALTQERYNVLRAINSTVHGAFRSIRDARASGTLPANCSNG